MITKDAVPKKDQWNQRKEDGLNVMHLHCLLQVIYVQHKD